MALAVEINVAPRKQNCQKIGSERVKPSLSPMIDFVSVLIGPGILRIELCCTLIVMLFVRL